MPFGELKGIVAEAAVARPIGSTNVLRSSWAAGSLDVFTLFGHWIRIGLATMTAQPTTGV